MVLIFAWLQAKHKHLKKYAELYINQGFDVVVAQITPWQLLWPIKGSQVVAADILKFLHNNDSYSPIIIHGFSVGGYCMGEVMVHMARELDKYKPLLNRVIAQVWDSAADITEIPEGVPKALFPRNPTLQKALRSYMMYHLKTFHDAATVHYIRSSQMFHSNLVHAPALFLISKTDPIGAEASNQRVRESWESKGIQVNFLFSCMSVQENNYFFIFRSLGSAGIDHHTLVTFVNILKNMCNVYSIILTLSILYEIRKN